MKARYLFYVLLLVLIVGCSSENVEPLDNKSNEISVFSINSDSGTVTQCAERGLLNRIVMIHAEHCGACKSTMPDVDSAALEAQVEVIKLDLDDPIDREKFNNYQISVKYTPTFIIDCEYFVGKKEFNEYKTLFEAVLE